MLVVLYGQFMMHGQRNIKLDTVDFIENKHLRLWAWWKEECVLKSFVLRIFYGNRVFEKKVAKKLFDN